jgi:hypothetical protein
MRGGIERSRVWELPDGMDLGLTRIQRRKTLYEQSIHAMTSLRTVLRVACESPQLVPALLPACLIMPAGKACTSTSCSPT